MAIRAAALAFVDLAATVVPIAIRYEPRSMPAMLKHQEEFARHHERSIQLDVRDEQIDEALLVLTKVARMRDPTVADVRMNIDDEIVSLKSLTSQPTPWRDRVRHDLR